MTDTDGSGLRLLAGFLGDDDKRAIYDAALEIIGTVGMRVHQPAALELLGAAGAELVGDDLVRLPARLLERARSTAPAVVPVFDREGEPAMRLGGRRSYFGTGSDLMNVYDLETGQRRLAGLGDVTTAARLSNRRIPLLVRRSTSASAAAMNTAAARSASSGVTPGSTTSHAEASSRSASGALAVSTTSITSIPSGSALPSLLSTSAGSRLPVRAISRYSASLAAPVGAPPMYEIFGCGENPAE